MKTIIVPLDFSDDSINALEFAIEIANHAKSDIILLHIFKTGRFDFLKGIESVSITGDFEAVIDKYKTSLKGSFSYITRKGKVHREIIEQAKETKPFLIVMGSHGMSGFEEIWVGSNAFRVVSEAPCAVLTIRGDFKKRNINKIILPIDHSFASRQKVPMSIDLARLFDAVVYIAGMYEPNDKEAELKMKGYVVQIQGMLNKQNVKHETKLLEGKNFSKLTIDYATEADADLVLIMTEQEESISNMLLGGYAQQMVHHCPIPIISKHPREDLVIKTFLK